MCFINCHLAAGQTQTSNRNNDITAIFESDIFGVERDNDARSNCFVGGGDGSRVLDHEICILNGDLNYRIDTMGRDTVIKAINTNNLAKLLERDQLLVSRRRNPNFALRALHEDVVTFAPTYKYDIRSDEYDTSEKRRSPAWCDRILFRKSEKTVQTSYQRHELRISDHRPVTAQFNLRVKNIKSSNRAAVYAQGEKDFKKVEAVLSREAK